MTNMRLAARLSGLCGIATIVAGSAYFLLAKDGPAAMALLMGSGLLLTVGAILLGWSDRRRVGTSGKLVDDSGSDLLTGLADRSAFRLEVERRLAGPIGEEVAVLLADLDRFKEVNDTLGHDTGDQLLRRVAERFAPLADSAIFLGRLGGDEFAAVASGEGASARIEALAAAMLEAAASPFVTDEDYISVGVSIGIAVGQVGQISSRELHRRSDVAMYRAKWDKKHPIQLFDPQMDEALSFKRVMRNDLAIAITEDQLSLVLQPVVNARTGELASAEALLRWNHPMLGSISPAKLIPLAEESGQIFEIDDWVLEHALLYARELPNVPIAINVSPGQFRHHGFARKVVDRLAAHNVPAASLRVEITEGVLVSHTRIANRVMQELREAGIEIALDDFGTGFSSLSYLKHFQFDFLKVDRSFIVDVDSGKQGAELLRAIVDIGHSLNMQVVAEGVETEVQARMIQLLGCDYIQGYFTGAPSTLESLKRHIPSERLVRDQANIVPLSEARR